jgi:hypothetical protein
MFNPDFYDPALSKEITSYIDPYLHFLLILREQFVDQKQDEVYTYISEMIEQPPNDIDQYKLFIVLCCYSTDVNTILSVIDNLNLDMNHPYLNNLDAYPITFEGLHSAISRGRDLQLVRDCRNIIASDMDNQLYIDFLGSGVTFNPSKIRNITRNIVNFLDEDLQVEWLTALELYFGYRPFDYNIARLYLDNGADPSRIFLNCIDNYMNVYNGSIYLKDPSMLQFISNMIDIIPPEKLYTLLDQVMSKDSYYLPDVKQNVYNLFSSLK